MSTSRQAAVAGLFYPADDGQLSAAVADFLRQPEGFSPGRRPLGLIVPHAGYVYSGQMAGSAYQLLAAYREKISRVVLIGPSHRVAFSGIALPTVDRFETPLGDVPLDRPGLEELLGLDGVRAMDQAHAEEHCLEVQLPFLIQSLPHFTLIPMVIGQAAPALVARALKALLGPETLLVISSDLSHFHDDQTARRLDQSTAQAICDLRGELDGEQACGCNGINGLVDLARELNWRIETLGLCNSSDTAGSADRVVGYGSFAVYDA